MSRWNNKNCGFQKGHQINNGKHRSFKTEFKKGIHPKTEFKKGQKVFVPNEARKRAGKKISEKLKGRKLSEKTKEKMRKSAFEYAKKIADIICPRVGKNENKILDKMEQELKYKILRQFKVAGYFIDGYIPELKLAIEIDEKPKNQDKDIEREEIIKQKLGCKFLRIKDYD